VEKREKENSGLKLTKKKLNDVKSGDGGGFPKPPKDACQSACWKCDTTAEQLGLIVDQDYVN
jgi:hypothetical protein